MNKIMIIGDCHGRFNDLNTLISKKKPDTILQCGDFGYFPKEFNKSYIDTMGRIKTWKADIKNHNTKIYWADGNHEDHESLKARTTDELWPNVFYQPRGSVRMLPDGRNVLFMGGAYSIDSAYRTAGYDWFPEDEKINQRDINDLPDVKVDIVISHTVPIEFVIKDSRKELRLIPDSSRQALSYILKKYRPKQWYFGHFHHYQKGLYNDCYWTALGDIGGDNKCYEVI